MDDIDEREARVERAQRLRRESEQTLDRLAELDLDVHVDKSRGQHHDPVRRDPRWRDEPQPAAPTARHLTDAQ